MPPSTFDGDMENLQTDNTDLSGFAGDDRVQAQRRRQHRRHPDPRWRHVRSRPCRRSRPPGRDIQVGTFDLNADVAQNVHRRQPALRHRPAALRPGLPRRHRHLPEADQRQRHRRRPAGLLRSRRSSPRTTPKTSSSSPRTAPAEPGRAGCPGLSRGPGRRPVTADGPVHRDPRRAHHEHDRQQPSRRRRLSASPSRTSGSPARTGLARILRRPEIGAMVGALVIFLFFALTHRPVRRAGRRQHLDLQRRPRSASWRSPSPC